MKDGFITAGLMLGFAILVTTHVGLSFRLLMHKPRWRGPVGLVVPPLAVMWAFKEGWKGLAGLWIGAVAVYGAALIAARI